jgi:hypothetical protein
MFDRSACAKVRLAADPRADLSSLVALGSLLRDVLHNRPAGSNVSDSTVSKSLAADLKSVWTAPTTDARLKKRIVRTLIHEVIADIDQKAAEIILLVHWVGGVHSEIRLPKRRRGQRNSTSADVIAAVRQLVLIAKDDLIAGILNRNGLTTGHGNRWTRERALRCARIIA